MKLPPPTRVLMLLKVSEKMYKLFTAREGPGWFLPCPSPPGPHQIILRKALNEYTKITKTKQTPNELQVNIRVSEHIRSANGHWATLDCSCMRDLCGIYAGSMREMQASACWPAPFRIPRRTSQGLCQATALGPTQPGPIPINETNEKLPYEEASERPRFL